VTRVELLDRLASAVAVGRRVRVAVDGPPAGGKTMLADELAVVLRARGREVVRAGVDSFLWPRVRRYRRGPYSPEGCYRDSFDYGSLHRVLLDPLGPDGDGKYRDTVYDRATDSVVSPPLRSAGPEAVLLFDGVFLRRPELAGRWDLSIVVTAPFERTLERARTRDLGRLGSAAEVERFFHERYRPAQELYATEVRPADFVVDNDDPVRPALIPGGCV
jgi:uridine kinase